MKKINQTYFVNGKFIPDRKAFISVLDIGLLRGYGVFDFLITYNGRPFLIDDHIDRLFNSAKQIGLKIGKSKRYIKKSVLETLKKNSSENEKAIRIVVTGGVGNSSTEPSEKSTIIIIVDPRHRHPDLYYRKGVKVITYNYIRPTPLVKSLEYTGSIKALNLAKKKHALEAIFIDNKSQTVSEATTSNVFIVKTNYIYTSNRNVLNGVTKDLLIKLLNEYPVRQKTIYIKDLISADEVFITASNKEIMPVVNIDNRIVGNGKVGPVTKKVMRVFKEFVDSGKW